MQPRETGLNDPHAHGDDMSAESSGTPQKPAGKEQEQASSMTPEQRKLLFIVTGVAVCLLMMIVGAAVVVSPAMSPPPVEVEEMPVVDVDIEDLLVALKNKENSVYSSAGFLTDEEGNTTEYLLNTRKKNNGEEEVLVNKVVNGELNKDWVPLEEVRDEMEGLKPPPGAGELPESENGEIYSYAGTGVDGETGEELRLIVRTPAPSEEEKETQVSQKGSSGYESEWASVFGGDVEMLDRMSGTYTAASLPGKGGTGKRTGASTLENTESSVYSVTGEQIDAEGNKTDYVINTRWGGWGSEAFSETLVNERKNGELSSEWVYLKDAEIGELENQGVLPQNDPSKIYSYAGGGTNDQGQEVAYVVETSRYDEEAVSRVNSIVPGQSSGSWEEIMQSDVSKEAQPFIANNGATASGSVATVPQTIRRIQTDAAVSLASIAGTSQGGGGDDPMIDPTDSSVLVASAGGGGRSSSGGSSSSSSAAAGQGTSSSQSSERSVQSKSPSSSSGSSQQGSAASGSSSGGSSQAMSTPRSSDGSKVDSSAFRKGADVMPSASSQAEEGDSKSKAVADGSSSKSGDGASSDGEVWTDSQEAVDRFESLYKTLQVFGGVLLLVGCVICGILFTSGRTTSAIFLFGGTVVIFGGAFLVGLVRDSLS